MSTIPPRAEYSPGSRTVPVRAYPLASRNRDSAVGSMSSPGASDKARPANALRGGTRCTIALTVVSTIRAPPGSACNCASVAIRSDTSSGFGLTRSYGRQSQAGNRNTWILGEKNASASATRAIRASSRATCSTGP